MSGDKQILSRPSAELMTTDHLTNQQDLIVLSQRQLSGPHLPDYAQGFWDSVAQSVDV